MKIQLPQSVQTIINTLSSAGYEAYAVGGCVRDSITGATPNDWDICTNALPQEVEKTFDGFHIIETGLQHGTVTLMIDHIGYEITTYRTEGTYSDRRKPDYVNFVTDLKEDVKRRDFTVNAMAYNDSDGLQDFFGGREDLKDRVIRCVGVADERFNEDALRILRAMRFASTFDFEIDPDTAEAMHKNKGLLSYVSRERISTELLKLLKGNGAARILREFSDILCEVIPEIEPCIGFKQNNPNHTADVWEHTLLAVDAAVNDPIIRLTMLLHDIGKPESYTEENGVGHFYGHPEISAEIAKTVTKRLKMSNEIITTVCTLVKYHDSLYGIKDKGIKRLLNKITPEMTRFLVQVARADMAAQSPDAAEKNAAWLEHVEHTIDRIIANNECFKVSDLAIGGKDLIAEGITPGRELGIILDKLLEMVIDGSAENSREALLAALKKIM